MNSQSLKSTEMQQPKSQLPSVFPFPQLDLPCGSALPTFSSRAHPVQLTPCASYPSAFKDPCSLSHPHSTSADVIRSKQVSHPEAEDTIRCKGRGFRALREASFMSTRSWTPSKVQVSPTCNTGHTWSFLSSAAEHTAFLLSLSWPALRLHGWPGLDQQ